MFRDSRRAAAYGGLLALFFAPAILAASLDYQKLFSGNNHVHITAVAADGAGNAYVAGWTAASDLPVKNAAQPRNAGTATTVSRDGGLTWSPLADLRTANAATPHPRNPNLVLATGLYGVYRSTDGGTTWSTVIDLEAERARIGYVDPAQWDPRDASAAYVPSTAGVLKSFDGGVTWRLMNNGTQPGNCCTGEGLALDPFVAGRIVFTIENRAYLSTDAGASWTRLSVPPSMRYPFVVMDPFVTGVWYVHDYEAAYRSEDAGASWTRLPLETRTFGWILPDPNVSGRLYARVDEGLRRSEDRGRTWSAIAFPDLQPKMGTLTALAIRPGDSNWILASGASDRGAVCLLSRDGGRTWSPMGVNRIFDSFRFAPSNPLVVYGAGTPTEDAFVAKINAAGEVVYTTYLGGQGADMATAMSVDASGSVYLAGKSESVDFPGAPARLYPGNAPGMFAARLDREGKPVWSTLFGGGANEYLLAVAHGADGTLALGGYSGTLTFVSRLAPDGRTFLFTSNTQGLLNSVAVDVAGNVYAAGAFAGAQTAHLLKLGPAGDLVTSRTLPVTPERAVVDPNGTVLVAGAITDPGPYAPGIEKRCPLPIGAREQNRSFYMTDIYVAKIEGDVVRSEEVFGGECRDTIADLAVVGDETVVAGETASDPFPVAGPLFVPPPTGFPRPFVARLDARGNLSFSTYLPFGAGVRMAAGQTSAYVIENTPDAVYSELRAGRLLAFRTTSGSPAPRRIVDAFTRSNRSITAQEIVVVEMPGLHLAAEIDLGVQYAGAPLLELGGVSVEFNGVRAAVLAVRNGEVVCITPASLRGPLLASVEVIERGARSGAFYVEVAEVNPAIYGVLDASGGLNSRRNPAAPGSEVTLLITGVGSRGPGSAPLRLGVSVGVGAQVETDHIEPVAGFVAGMYGVRVRLPGTSGQFPLALNYALPTMFAYPATARSTEVFVGVPRPPNRRHAPADGGRKPGERPRPGGQLR